METRIKKYVGGVLALSAALVVGACLNPTGDGEGLTKQGDVPPPVLLLSDVRPIFNQCSGCHGASGPSGNMSLNNLVNATNAFFIITPGDTVPRPAFTTAGTGKNRIQPGSPDSSHLWERITSSDPSIMMPPSGSRVSDADKATIRQWIEEGARLVAPPIE
jgi:hypothetical protein